MKIEINIPAGYFGETQKHRLHLMLTEEINDTCRDINNQILWIKRSDTEEQAQMHRQNVDELIKCHEILRIIKMAMD